MQPLSQQALGLQRLVSAWASEEVSLQGLMAPVLGQALPADGVRFALVLQQELEEALTATGTRFALVR